MQNVHRHARILVLVRSTQRWRMEKCVSKTQKAYADKMEKMAFWHNWFAKQIKRMVRLTWKPTFSFWINEIIASNHSINEYIEKNF